MQRRESKSIEKFWSAKRRSVSVSVDWTIDRMAGTNRLKTIGRNRRLPAGKDPFANYKELIGPQHDYFFNRIKPSKRTPTRSKLETPAKRMKKQISPETSLLLDQEKLVVNKKKVNEVREWLESKITGEHTGKTCLLISGPSGSGKTSTLRTLCDDLDFDVTEWETFADIEEKESFISDNVITETDLFTDFINDKGSKCIMAGGRTRRLKLIKEIPNYLVRDPQRLQTVLRDTIPHSNFITIFLLTTIENNYELCIHRYLPETFLKELNIHHIKFNPISTTAMRTYVKDLVGKSNGKISDQIVETSNDNDLRTAMVMSNLYNKHDGKVESSFFQKSESFVQLHHYIGKVLYAKRLDKTPEWTKSQSSMGIEVNPDDRREKPPKESIAKLLRICPVKCDTMIDFVSEHELPLFKAYLPRVARVYDDLCHVSAMLNEYQFRITPVVDELGTEIIIASTLFNNYTTGGLSQRKKRTEHTTSLQNRKHAFQQIIVDEVAYIWIKLL
ncbi:hypothetical protein M3Y96_01113600 [Aphelenchoides besseyi]|nr:hypothetical protein M3Y96_01113600 [Aphelenchoides besseyi]